MPAIATFDELTTLLDVQLRELQSLESAAAAAGTNSGIENELAVRRDKIAQLKDRIANFDATGPSADAEAGLALASPARVEEQLEAIAEAHRPSGAPASNPRPPAIRLSGDGVVPKLGEGHSVRLGQYGSPKPRPAPISQATPEPPPSSSLAPANSALPGEYPAAGVQIPDGPRITIFASPDGSVRTEISGTKSC